MDNRRIIILGSGPAGLTAAIYAGRAGLSPEVWDGPSPGGALMTTPRIENFPGFPSGIGGADLVFHMRDQAERWGATFRSASAVRAEPRPGGGAILRAGDGSETACDALVVATGALPRPLGLPGEDELRGHGVSYCATCDGAFFRGRNVAVVGGGDTACEEAVFLARLAARVTLVHRRDRLRASAVLAQRVAATPNLDIRWNSRVAALLRDGNRLSGVRLAATDASTDAPDAGEDLPLDGLFVAVGVVPASAPFAGFLPLGDDGTILASGVATPHPGVFVAGDVSDARHRQAIAAAGAGCRAAMEAIRHLETLAQGAP